MITCEEPVYVSFLKGEQAEAIAAALLSTNVGKYVNIFIERLLSV